MAGTVILSVICNEELRTVTVLLAGTIGGPVTRRFRPDSRLKTTEVMSPMIDGRGAGAAAAVTSAAAVDLSGVVDSTAARSEDWTAGVADVVFSEVSGSLAVSTAVVSEGAASACLRAFVSPFHARSSR